jgi:hypothetical protein
MDETILARADALMQRRRTTPGESDEVPVLTAVAVPGDDFPVLTEAVPANSGAVVGFAPEPEAGPTRLAAMPPHQPDSQIPEASVIVAPVTAADPALLLTSLTDELARRVEARLAAEVPRLITATLHELLSERGISIPGNRQT